MPNAIMSIETILSNISRGRTDHIVDLMRFDDWREVVVSGDVSPLQWLMYYGDVTAVRSVIDAGVDLSTIDLNEELGNAAFHGHWKLADLLIVNGADVNSSVPGTGETPLHNAITKAGRPHYFYTVRLLVQNGADVNAKTIPGRETGAFMRDVRTKGETPLHRAAAYSDRETIEYLIENGAEIECRDANGDSPLAWASEHLRPAAILQLLAFPPHNISDRHIENITTDHGCGWGYGLERNMLGEFVTDSIGNKDK